MASGVNTTFRQIGIAAGIAALGSIFTSAMLHSLTHASPLASSASRAGTMIRQGQVSQLIASMPQGRRAAEDKPLRPSGPRSRPA
jgi:hypothetical protein